MSWIVELDEYICTQFDTFRSSVNDDLLWLSLIVGILLVCVLSAFLLGGLLGGLVWFFVVWQYMYLHDYWPAVTSKDATNARRNIKDSSIRIFVFAVSLIALPLGAIQVLLFAIALYMCSAHRISPTA